MKEELLAAKEKLEGQAAMSTEKKLQTPKVKRMIAQLEVRIFIDNVLKSCRKCAFPVCPVGSRTISNS